MRRLLTFTVTVVLLASCGGSSTNSGGGGSSGTIPTPDATTKAWLDCKATKVPPTSVLDAKVPQGVTLDFSHSLTPDQRDRGLQAFIRTYAILNWAIENNELAFLQSDCVSLPMGQAEADDIEGVKKAEALHGHVIDDPPAHFITIGVEAVPANISDTVLRRLGVRPNIAVITVTEGAEIWVGDTKGHHIKQLAKTDPGERVFTITLGQIKDDGIGLRIWQTGVYGCLNTEVAGLCDGVV